MLSIYKNCWKNMFNFSGEGSWKEFRICFGVTVLILMISHALLILLPPSMENLGLEVWGFARYVLGFPLIPLLVRISNSKKHK